MFSFAGSILFFLTMFLMDGPVEKVEIEETRTTVTSGMDNKAFENEMTVRNAGKSLPTAPRDASRL